MVLDWTRLLLGADLFRLSYLDKLWQWLTLAFFFVNCFALTTIYGILFVYIRVVASRIRKLSTINGSENQQSWRANLEGGTATSQPITAKQITVTRTLSITTEQRLLRQQSQITDTANHSHYRLLKVSKVLLCYPLVYVLFTLPTAIIRLGQFAGKPWSITTAFVVVDINILSGFCNVILYTSTRKGMVPWQKLFALCGSRRGNSTDTTHGTSSRDSYSSDAEFDTTLELQSTLEPKPSISSIQSHGPKTSSGAHIEFQHSAVEV